MWQITFVGFSSENDARDFVGGVKTSIFYKKHISEPQVHVEATKVVFCFQTSFTRHRISNVLCNQLKKLGNYKQHSLEEVDASTLAISTAASSTSLIVPMAEPARSTSPSVPAAEPVQMTSTLAVPCKVEDIKRMSGSCSRMDCHALAFYFAARAYLPDDVSRMGELMKAKCAAAGIFQQPASSWRELLTEQAPQSDTRCQCSCGCKASAKTLHFCQGFFKDPAHVNDDYTIIPGCRQIVCNACLDICKGLKICHVCSKKPKKDEFVEPAEKMDGIDWYFNWPDEQKEVKVGILGTIGQKDVPHSLFKLNRDCLMDPPLMDILEIKKDYVLENTSRRVRPPGWQQAFTVTAKLGTADDFILAGISLSSFAMNKNWAQHSAVKFIEEDFLPGNFHYVGNCINMPSAIISEPRPPSPVSPDAYCGGESGDDAATYDEHDEDKDDDEDFVEIMRGVKRLKTERDAQMASALGAFFTSSTVQIEEVIDNALEDA
eukprot:CAMPEP_0197659024 /NCGR_PEP_ID=MMETSP1338-20131121/45892_1 /TAXON_ID=43686 ORGANISM="Pelagodinium beii, Strain RCC1491" /NCGR_SAMPLE_ID=MMETSP1338 /ASSEMBLY_ACC=CAM_ASM_000754 /LENGTH=489 /DNA_ID=CAMNT_0043235765 /DNA_START=35 /DNA_END=1504 /DNA_ORIENTATION=+